MIGSTISHYVVEDLLGEGGMGKVYRARDTVLNRTVAIKILGTSVGGDSESKRRILREARAACALNHPNVVTIHSVEEERELDFIVMEHVAGARVDDPPCWPADRSGDRLRRSDHLRAGGRSRSRHHPPGHQASQRDGRSQRTRQGSGFRNRQADGVAWRCRDAQADRRNARQRPV